MTLGTRHLHDDRLLDCYMAARHGEALDPPIAEHLTDCRACGARYDEFVRLMDAVRAEGRAEADAVFTPERLRDQQHHIARRIEHVGRAARVITFPHPIEHRITSGSPSHSAPRWIAAGAAAGLFLGIALGASYEWEWTARTSRLARRAAENDIVSSALIPLGTRGNEPAPIVATDDAFLSELEGVLDRPRTSELRPFDALTPHVRDISDLR